MKVFFALVVVISLELSKVAALVCWECYDIYGGQEECLRRGKAVKCRNGQEFCELHIRHLGNKNRIPWIEKTCKSAHSCMNNVIQNAKPAWSFGGKQIQCNEHFPSSVCRCCCSGDLCNYNQTSCLVKTECPGIEKFKHGVMTCTSEFRISSICKFKCKPGFGMVGDEETYCRPNGKWSKQFPTCKRITCREPQKTPEFGSKTCTKGIKLGSKCQFSCQEGYRIYGRNLSECIDDTDGDEYGVWSIMPPICQPKKCDTELTLYHGTIKCTNRNYVGSTCTYSCNENTQYELYPPNASPILTCLPNEKWNNPRPCCTHRCPPFAIMDFVVVLDSSSSVGFANWEKMVNFVSSFVGKFQIQDDAAQVAVIKYNRRVDRNAIINLRSYANDKEGLLRAINSLPYDNGEGTNTGRAIAYVNYMLRRKSSGNRELARDIVLIMTDGDSQDHVAIRARTLRRSGALVFALPIGNVNENTILNIVGRSNRGNIIEGARSRGFDALDDEFANEIANRLCTEPCYNPLHNHPPHDFDDHDHDHDD